MLRAGFLKLCQNGSCSSSFRSLVSQRAFASITNDEDDQHTSSYSGGVEKCVNAVTLLGRVGIDPQRRGTESHPVVVFSLATSQRFKPKESKEHVTKTDWHNIAVFRPYLRDTVENNVTKGMRVLVQGKIMYGTVEDKEGVTRHTTTIVAEDVIRLAKNNNY